jgi:chromosomal replication initiation ATPase DnaA
MRDYLLFERDYLLSGQRRARVIIRRICNEYAVSKSDLIGHCRKKLFVKPRHLAYYTIYKTGRYSLKQIATMFGKRHHTSVMHGITKNEKLNDCRSSPLLI